VIQKLTHQDIDKAVKLYRRELPGLLAELGTGFLKKFYKVLLSLPDCWVFVEKEDEQILGLTSGILSVGGLYKTIFLRDILGFTSIFLGIFITRPVLLIKIIQMMLYPGFKSDIPELLTIVVDPRYRRKGMGRKLFMKIVAEFKKKGVKEFRISVYDYLPSYGFYQKIGCQKKTSFYIGRQKINYYLYKIK